MKIGLLVIAYFLCLPFIGLAEDENSDFEEEYSRSDLSSQNDIESLFKIALKLDNSSKIEAFNLLLDSEKGINRRKLLDLIDKEDVEIKKGMFVEALKSNNVWTYSSKGGEGSAGHYVFLTSCANAITKMGFECSRAELSDKSFRLSLSKKVSTSEGLNDTLVEPKTDRRNTRTDYGERFGVTESSGDGENKKNYKKEFDPEEERLANEEETFPWIIVGALVSGLLVLLFMMRKIRP